MSCSHCGQPVEPRFRYCPWCGLAQRRKLVEFFRGHEDIDRGRSLRVSRYFRTPDQAPHVRFSVWSEEGEAEAAVSIDDEEAARLAVFVRPHVHARPNRLREMLHHMRVR